MGRQRVVVEFNATHESACSQTREFVEQLKLTGTLIEVVQVVNHPGHSDEYTTDVLKGPQVH